MEWLQILSLFIANFGLILWFRSESREDWSHIDNKTDQLDLLIRAEVREFREEHKEFKERWLEETKDFHKRLCEIEAKRSK